MTDELLNSMFLLLGGTSVDTRFFPSHLIPVLYVDIGGLVIAIVVAISLLYKLGWWQKRMLSKWLKQDITSSLKVGEQIRVLGRVVAKDALAVEPLFHHYKKRWLAHFLVFYGFIGLMITTTLDAIINRPANPLPLDSPVKIIGNLSGLMLLVGATAMLFPGYMGRQHMTEVGVENDKAARPLGFSDRVFLPVLYLTVLTGFITEIFDYSGVPTDATIVYAIHIILITALLVSAPWTRFVHAVQAPFLALYERLRQAIEEKAGPRVDYKRMTLAEYVKMNFYPQYLTKEEAESKSDKNAANDTK